MSFAIRHYDAHIITCPICKFDLPRASGNGTVAGFNIFARKNPAYTEAGYLLTFKYRHHQLSELKWLQH